VWHCWPEECAKLGSCIGDISNCNASRRGNRLSDAVVAYRPASISIMQRAALLAIAIRHSTTPDHQATAQYHAFKEQF
jgi:hypothetical protein